MIDYLITGGNGFIGRNLTHSLSTSGKSFIVVDLRANGFAVEYTYDVTYQIPRIQSNTIIHLASETNVRESIKLPLHTFRRNCEGVLNCLEMIRDLNLSSRLIFTSSASSFNSSSPYLASKQSCESICKAYKESFGIDTRILKLSNVYGPFSVHKHSVIPKFIKSCLLFKPLQIFGDGTQQRDFVHVRDVISSIINGQEGFITSGIGTRIIDLAEMISSISDKLLNYRPKIVFENSISGEVKVPRFLSSITPSINLEDGLLSTFKWFKENYETKLLVNA